MAKNLANSTPTFLTKAKLYEMVTQKAASLGFNVFAQNYKIDARRLAMKCCLNLHIEIVPFEDLKICGVLYKGEFSTVIGLNARRSATGKNFDCMHELIHYWFHPQSSFYCADDAKNHLEWQANSGAAQFLMPYQSFIPNYCDLHDKLYARLQPDAAYDALVTVLARNYMVGEMAVKIHIDSLAAEIGQYIDGVGVDKIKITSPKRS